MKAKREKKRKLLFLGIDNPVELRYNMKNDKQKGAQK